MLQTRVVEKSKHILCSMTFFPLISCVYWDSVEKYFRTLQATDEKYCACAFHDGNERLQTHTHNI